MTALLSIASCKKEDDSPATGGVIPGSDMITATPPPLGFQFPKTFKQTQQFFDFRIWVKGQDVSNSVKANQVFDIQEWDPITITLSDRNNVEIKNLKLGESFSLKYFYFKNGLYFVDDLDTLPLPVAFGDYHQLELYDYRIRITSARGSLTKSVFEKSTKASLEKEAAKNDMSNIDTMAYLNKSLILK